MEPGSLPKPSDDAKTAFTKLVPDGPTVTLRPMFGNLAAFVNGNLFTGLFGEDLFVRLSDDENAKVRKQAATTRPYAGAPDEGYVMVPGTWRSKPAPVKAWIACAETGRMPPKADLKSAAKKK
jgi:TfoX/Sxy family transcriptional regulator of competence genes